MKNYIKPAIAFQTLEMSASVSSGCAHRAENQEFICPAKLPGQDFTVFIEDGRCDTYMPGMENVICYHVPQADMNVFES